jgi:hypothetical protein
MPGPDRDFWQRRFEQRPSYHMDIHAVRALLPAMRWDWPAPPFPALPHPAGWTELAICLVRL